MDWTNRCEPHERLRFSRRTMVGGGGCGRHAARGLTSVTLYYPVEAEADYWQAGQI